jgi:hypothetical protein
MTDFKQENVLGFPIYHTNVILSICTDFVMVCEEAIAPEDRGRTMEKLSRGNRWSIYRQLGNR